MGSNVLYNSITIPDTKGLGVCIESLNVINKSNVYSYVYSIKQTKILQLIAYINWENETL